MGTARTDLINVWIGKYEKKKIKRLYRYKHKRNENILNVKSKSTFKSIYELKTMVKELKTETVTVIIRFTPHSIEKLSIFFT
jgi:hypothetical protein